MIENRKDKETETASIISVVFTWLWRFFSSVKLAIILILIVAGLSLIGVFLIQVPPEMAHDSLTYQSWVEHVAENKVGAWAPLLSLLQLFNIFGSFWFLGTGGLLILNIIICSLNRWRNIKMSLHGGTIKHPENFFTSSKDGSYAEFVLVPMSETETAQLMGNVLRQRHYRVRIESDKDNVYIAADKNRYYRLATYVSHLSLILFVLAFTLGSLMGWRITNFTVAEGDRPQEIGHGTNLSLQLNSFVAEYYDNGSPKDYRSLVTLFENGRQIREALIRVNHPLEYKGVRFFQSTFGSAMQLKVSKASTATTGSPSTTNDPSPSENNLIYDGSVVVTPMGNQMSGYNLGYLNLPEQGYTVYVIHSSNPKDTQIPEGSVGIEIINSDNTESGFYTIPQDNPIVIADLEFIYSGDSSYSGFQVSKDPVNILFWIGSGLFILGISLVLFFPYRQVWVWSKGDSERTSRVLMRTIAPRNVNDRAELTALSAGLEKQLATEPTGKE